MGAMDSLLNTALVVAALIGALSLLLFLGASRLMRQGRRHIGSGAAMMARSEMRLEESIALQRRTVALLEELLAEQRRGRGASAS